jgi:hypothetical protein
MNPIYLPSKAYLTYLWFESYNANLYRLNLDGNTIAKVHIYSNTPKERLNIHYMGLEEPPRFFVHK